ncbi:hypothetical protein D0Y65_054306 [Glycine soja]|uniref:Uncharacterized protein n=1 Tax=Glycine soja TaxID=3848 RepID=A0A445F644_GLYSO|nr:hypothetical protein D0Y65_054306 [Glycine soja]
MTFFVLRSCLRPLFRSSPPSPFPSTANHPLPLHRRESKKDFFNNVEILRGLVQEHILYVGDLSNSFIGRSSENQILSSRSLLKI